MIELRWHERERQAAALAHHCGRTGTPPPAAAREDGVGDAVGADDADRQRSGCRRTSRASRMPGTVGIDAGSGLVAPFLGGSRAEDVSLEEHALEPAPAPADAGAARGWLRDMPTATRTVVAARRSRCSCSSSTGNHRRVVFGDDLHVEPMTMIAVGDDLRSSCAGASLRSTGAAVGGAADGASSRDLSARR